MSNELEILASLNWFLITTFCLGGFACGYCLGVINRKPPTGTDENGNEVNPYSW